MAVTWAQVGTYGVTGTCTLATESGPTLVTEGLSLSGLASFTVSYEAASGALTPSTGKLAAYLWNPLSGSSNKWFRFQAGDLTLGDATGIGAASWMGFSTNSFSGWRVAYVPVSIGQAGTVYIVGTKV